MDHAGRIERLMKERETPLLVTSLVNIRYLTGFTGSNAFLFVGPDRNVLVTDGRYGEMAEPLAAAIPATSLRVYIGQLGDNLAAAAGDVADLDVEAAHVSWEFSRTLRDMFEAEIHPTSGIVEEHRRIKDADEVAALRAAAAAGDVAFSRLAELAAAAPDEISLGEALVDAMRTAGADSADWEPIVAAGANASRPHHESGATPVGDGPLLVDYGCVVDGYHSDMTRTVWIGDNGDPEMEAVYAAVLASNLAGIAAVRPGVVAGDVDEACRAVLRTAGYDEFFVHSTGHGVGLEIHEAPWLRAGGEQVLQPGDVVTVEPGVYIPGRGGARVEDMVLVTEHGAEVLTHASKELHIR